MLRTAFRCARSQQRYMLCSPTCPASRAREMSILRLATARTAAVSSCPQNRILQQHTLSFSALAPVAKEVTVTFVEPDGAEIEATGEEGTNLMELAHENDVDLEGACEGACACSTCHVILEDKIYDELPEPSDEENDMLDLAFGLTDTSRLGCQVELTPDMEGMRIKLPSATRNFYVDGAKPAHH